jgi:hypothetical protein
MLIGSKEVFAIEYEITQLGKHGTLFGKVVLWLNGLYLGHYDEEIIMNNFNNMLLDFILPPGNVENYANLEELIISRDLQLFSEKENGWFIKCFSESFDDFLIAMVDDPDKVVFWWKLERKHLGRHAGYPHDVQLVVVDKATYRSVLLAYIDSLPSGFKSYTPPPGPSLRTRPTQ